MIVAYCKNKYSVSKEIANKKIVNPIVQLNNRRKQYTFQLIFIKIPPLNELYFSTFFYFVKFYI